jgi:hypothetical protein
MIPASGSRLFPNYCRTATKLQQPVPIRPGCRITTVPGHPGVDIPRLRAPAGFGPGLIPTYTAIDAVIPWHTIPTVMHSRVPVELIKLQRGLRHLGTYTWILCFYAQSINKRPHYER